MFFELLNIASLFYFLNTDVILSFFCQDDELLF